MSETGDVLGKAAEAMNLLREVRWDRCTRREDGGTAFGWIGRPDGRADFCLLLYGPAGVGFVTSSAALSAEFSRRLFGDADGHKPCERVEDVFGDRVANKVVLAGKGEAGGPRFWPPRSEYYKLSDEQYLGLMRQMGWCRSCDAYCFRHPELGECRACGGKADVLTPPPGECPRETQQSISAWADETFGPVSSNARVAARANEEMAELLRCLTADDAHPKAAEEAADVVIVLYRLAERLGVSLHDVVDAKMAKNRSREWRRDGTGHGYHVPKGGGNG